MPIPNIEHGDAASKHDGVQAQSVLEEANADDGNQHSCSTTATKVQITERVTSALILTKSKQKRNDQKPFKLKVSCLGCEIQCHQIHSSYVDITSNLANVQNL